MLRNISTLSLEGLNRDTYAQTGCKVILRWWNFLTSWTRWAVDAL